MVEETKKEAIKLPFYYSISLNFSSNSDLTLTKGPADKFSLM